VGTGKTIVVAVDGELAATITLGETWREGMAGVLGELGAMWVACEVLTGDAHPPGDLGVPVRGGLTPAAKTARIQELVTAGRTVVFVGDGVNDAAAMTAAAAGIALGEGSDLARAAAMAVLAGDDLRGLPGAVRLARAVRRGVRGNLWFALSYNVAGMALAAAGLLHPVVAALLMLGSSTAVAVRALRSAGELRVGSAATAQA
jgi:P-type E1-E2 ATPase